MFLVFLVQFLKKTLTHSWSLDFIKTRFVHKHCIIYRLIGMWRASVQSQRSSCPGSFSGRRTKSGRAKSVDTLEWWLVKRNSCLIIVSCGLRIKLSQTRTFPIPLSIVRSYVGVSMKILCLLSLYTRFVATLIRILGFYLIAHCCCFCHLESSSPEMHGTITGVFKNQIDWIPLNTGSVRPTQGKAWYVSPQCSA